MWSLRSEEKTKIYVIYLQKSFFFCNFALRNVTFECAAIVSKSYLTRLHIVAPFLMDHEDMTNRGAYWL